jgi:NAD(P)-dependent dehydrogenase (short-subunit alcohol dehydrogenase family)
MSARRVALITGADDYVGPELAKSMATRGYDLVLANASETLLRECTSLGAHTISINDASPHDEQTGPRMVARAAETFGGFHSAFFSSGRIALGRFLKTNVDDLRYAFEGNVVAPYLFVQAVLPQLLEQRDGQILVATSATANHPTPAASLYAGTRSGATTMLQSVGVELADSGVQVNVVGTNFMDFPGFLQGNRAETPEGRARVESLVPMKRLGTMTEFASFCAVFLDGTSRFQTGAFVPYAGGWAT